MKKNTLSREDAMGAKANTKNPRPEPQIAQMTQIQKDTNLGIRASKGIASRLPSRSSHLRG